MVAGSSHDTVSTVGQNSDKKLHSMCMQLVPVRIFFLVFFFQPLCGIEVINKGSGRNLSGKNQWINDRSQYKEAGLQNIRNQVID